MSWSVGAVGKAAAVKAALVPQFASAKESTKAIPHEQRSVGLVEQLVNDQLDFLAAMEVPQAVEVSAAGSAWTDKARGYSQVEVKVKNIPGFVE